MLRLAERKVGLQQHGVIAVGQGGGDGLLKRKNGSRLLRNAVKGGKKPREGDNDNACSFHQTRMYTVVPAAAIEP